MKEVSGTANVIEWNIHSKDDGTWAVIEVEEEANEPDWFDEAVAKLRIDDVVEDFQNTSGEVLAADIAAGNVELYDLGCTNHISPYHAKFENYKLIPLEFSKLQISNISAQSEKVI